MAKVTLEEIKSAINTAINEVKLGNIGALGKGSATPNQQTTANAPAKVEREEGGKQFPVVSYCYSKKDGEGGEPVVHLGLAYVYDQHMPILQKLYKRLEGEFQVAKKGKNMVEFIVPEKNIDTFKKIIPTFKEALKRASAMTHNAKYDEKKLENLANDIAVSLTSSPTSEELEKYDQTIAKNWRELQAKMNDPAVKQRLRGLGAFYVTTGGDSDIDHRLSDTNKMIILAQDPNATYVTQIAGWRKFNRVVKDESDYIMVKVPAHKPVSKATKDAVARKLGFGSYDSYKKMKRSGEIQRGRVHRFEMLCQIESTGADFAYFMKMYDIRNTELIPGSEDIFTTQEGYVNNIFGIPNDVATQNKEKVEKAIKDTAEKDSGTTEPSTGLTQAMLMNALNVVLRACREVGVDFKESGNISEDIGAAIYQYELKKAETEYHIAKPDERDAFAKSIAAAVSVSLDLKNSSLVSYVKQTDMSDKDAQEAFGEFAGIVSAISSKKGRETGTADVKAIKMVSEGIMKEGINNFADFKTFIKGIGINVVNDEQPLEEENEIPVDNSTGSSSDTVANDSNTYFGLNERMENLWK